MEELTVPLKREYKAKLPHKTHFEDAGFDLFSINKYKFNPGQVWKIDTGISMAIPTGYFGMVCDKSSVALKGLTVVGGIIDSSYRGKILVCLANFSNQTVFVEPEQKVAQLILFQTPLHVTFDEVDSLSRTDRGEGGFGSTGEF